MTDRLDAARLVRAPELDSRHLVGLALTIAIELVGGSSCKKWHDDPPLGGAPAASASGSPIAPSALPLPTAAGESSGAGLTPAEAMDRERSSRPGVHPSVDDAFAAFKTAGVDVELPKQSTGSDYAASYCAGAHASGTDLMVIVCEYPDEARAAAGLGLARQREPALGSRNLAQHRSLLIRVMDREVYRTAGTKEAWAKLMATFEAL